MNIENKIIYAYIVSNDLWETTEHIEIILRETYKIIGNIQQDGSVVTFQGGCGWSVDIHPNFNQLSVCHNSIVLHTVSAPGSSVKDMLSEMYGHLKPLWKDIPKKESVPIVMVF